MLFGRRHLLDNLYECFSMQIRRGLSVLSKTTFIRPPSMKIQQIISNDLIENLSDKVTYHILMV